MSYINRIRERLKVGSVGRGSSRDVDATSSRDLPLDHQLTFKRDADEEWKFKDGRILINEMDVEDLIDYESRDVRFWCGLTEALMEYKEMVVNRGGSGKSRFLARVESIQDKVLCNMKKLYEEKREGMYLSFGDGEFLLNNFNVRAFLAMYHVQPTEKARKFLIGLKSKLALILVNRNGTPQYERVHRVVQRLYEEVVSALSISPIETRRLPASSRNKFV